MIRARFHAAARRRRDRRRMAEIRAAREATQPVRARTGGSTFKNPPGHKAWALIDAAGCRGLRLGGAQVSEKHCNFLLNTGGATAAELEALGEEVRAPGAGRSPASRWSGKSSASGCRGMTAWRRGPARRHLGGARGQPRLRRRNASPRCARRGFEVTPIDVGPDLAATIAALRAARPDAVFNALHGRFGEDGCIQGVLDWLGLPYTHSGLRASALAMDKVAAKAVFRAAGLPVAPHRLVDAGGAGGGGPAAAALRGEAGERGLLGRRAYPARAATTAAPRSPPAGASAPPRWSRNSSPAAS